MKELLKLLAGPLYFLLEASRFKIVDSTRSRTSDHATVTLQSTTVRLEIVRDRTQNSIRFQAVDDPFQQWFWIGVLRRVLDGDRPGRDDLDSGAIEFLRRSLDSLDDRITSDESRVQLIADLTREQRARAAELF